MSTLRKLKAYIVGGVGVDHGAELKAADIPVSEVDCRGCANPCDEGHDEYPPRFDVDMETEMLGSMKPYAMQVVISTGKSDWEKEVTDASGTLAAYVDAARGESKPPKDKSANSAPAANGVGGLPGVYKSTETSKVTILNGSHRTVSDDATHETVLVFPQYKVVADVESSADGAKKLLHSLKNAKESEGLKTYVLPYASVVMLCSHKRRDNRCAIAAPKLEHTFTAALEREGWEVHTQVEDPSLSGPPLEEFAGSEEELNAEIEKRLKASAESKRVLVIRNSHMGGHKFAGNVIINTPQGACVWYGRVTPHEVDAIVKETVMGGKVLPPLLRGGLNISRPGHASLHDW
ncbi:Sucrase/ferredoxin-like-domain-containing protein [Rhodofomes roseus]|uniref:Sucrase/ferredoxin-like-domain-containing protein n=1 Tax=Rhodofomes roseus TaxID=34475 RepID=A0ABQ8KY23_9APHY|nr:Sucrase/ferredoxin-like-domain-containing protein [Rhodofomes roseus]KAH9844197.1 Sucrase/ferredoxin-like-domain-containing protein [Rhodofomes roseus]